MHTNRLMLFRGHGPVEAAASRYTAFIRNATGLGAKQISIYQAITDGVKGLEDYLVLSCVTTPEVICTNPLSASGQSIDVKAPLTDTPSPSSTTSEPSDHTQVEDTGMPAWVWGTNDVDGTDYKNMPDYDPNQEESVYESTPEPETEGLYVAREDGSMNAPSYIENYIKLWTVDSNRTDDDPAQANYLLVLFIPAPLEIIDPSVAPSPQPITRSRHDNFLAHLVRYPYMTSLDTYIRHTGFFLEAVDELSPSQYLVVQEFSDLEGTFKPDYQQKRTEAKHWWRRDGRRASGVRAGFYRLADVKDLSQEVSRELS